MNNANYIVTGAAGFIGSAVVIRLLKEGYNVLGLDNINSYYDVKLKRDRLKNIYKESKKFFGKWNFIKCDLSNKEKINDIFNTFKPNVVINLAAQAGVRYSMKNPSIYLESNVLGFNNILEVSAKNNVSNFVYASSSSVYGGNTSIPYVENQSVDHPLSIYAASKKANELIAHSYSNVYGLSVTGLRFFTVYGPWGRPDMAPMIFTKSILNNEKIKVFNHGNMMRDFTFIDDIVEGIYLCCNKPATINKEFNTNCPEPSTSFAPYRIFNIGNSKPINLKDFIISLENELGKKSLQEFLPLQIGDVISTYADTQKIHDWIGYKPNTPLNLGVKKFVEWYLNYYKCIS